MSLLSGLYGRAARARRAWYAQHPSRVRRLDRPVVSVGNLVVGGSGKTPVVAALALLLLEMGERPSILSRGYGRRRGADGVVVVSDAHRVLEPVERSGDEPQMLARALAGVPVLVSADRHLAGRIAERRFGSTVHLLDDGFQHVQLARDVDLLLVAPEDAHERVLPQGRLREPIDAARAADALLVSGGADPAPVARRLGVEPVFRVVPCYRELRMMAGAAEPRTCGASGRRAVAVAGIARPERFFAALEAAGFDVARRVAFRDHHWFTARDLAAIERAADAAHADLIVTTGKDAVRIAAPGPRWAWLPMDATLEPAAAFAAWMAQRLRDARAA